MARKEFPQNRQKPLVAQKHFPRRLDELNAIGRKVWSEFLMPQPFPGIEFEAAFDGLKVEVHEELPAVIPPDVLNVNAACLYPSLLARIAQIQNRLLVFGMLLDA